MKKTISSILLLLYVVIMMSCGSGGQDISDTLVAARVQPVTYSAAEYRYVTDGFVEVKYINKLYRPGDLIKLEQRGLEFDYIVHSIEHDCPFEMGECPSPNCEHSNDLFRDYQLEVHYDTVRIYDGRRLVGQYISTENEMLMTLILADNE